jgi:hypothetical protein
MFFGPQPIKQVSTSISGSGGGNVNPFNVSYAPPLPNSKVLTNLKVGAQLTQGEKKQLTDELVKFGTSNDRPVRDGQYLKLKALLDYKKDQFNDPLIPQDQKKTIFNEIERLMTIGNQLNFIGAGENGRMQTAATFLGVGYDGIKAPAPPSTPGVGAKGATGDVTQVWVPPSSSCQPNGSPEVIADVNQWFALAVESLNVTNTPSANRKALQDKAATFLQNSAPLYQEELFGIRNMATMAQVDAKYRLQPEFFSRAANVLSSSEETIFPDQVKEIQPLTLLGLLARNGGPDAKNVAIELLNALRKPTGQTEPNVASGSQVPLVPSEGDGAPIAGVPSEYA